MRKLSLPRFDERKKRVYRVALIGVIGVLFALTLSFGAFSSAPVAHAGGNGQLIGVISYGYSASIFGYNQNQQYVNKHCISTPDVPPSWGSNTSTGWWFESYNSTNVTVYIYSNGGCPSGQAYDSMTCYVPPSQTQNYVVFDFTQHNCFSA